MGERDQQYRVRLMESIHEWAAIAGRWNQLAGNHVFCRFEWLYRWWHHFGHDRGRLFLVLVEDRDAVIQGIAPWWLESSIARGRVLQFLGSGDVCSDYLTVLAESRQRDAVMSAIAQWLAGQRGWDVLELDGAAEEDPASSVLVEECRKIGMPIGRKNAMNCWRLGLPASWEDYLAVLSKCHRKQLRRIDRRILQTGRLRFRVAETERERERFFGDLVQLHQRRWERLGEPGVFACPRFLGFLREIAVDWFQEGRARLYEMCDGDRPLAAEIHFVDNGVSYAYQSGVDPDALELEPGRAMNVAVIQHLIGEGMTALDFLRGDEPYKKHLRALPCPLSHFRIGAPRPSGRLRHQAWLAGGAVKSWIKSTTSVGGVPAQ